MRRPVGRLDLEMARADKFADQRRNRNRHPPAPWNARSGPFGRAEPSPRTPVKESSTKISRSTPLASAPFPRAASWFGPNRQGMSMTFSFRSFCDRRTSDYAKDSLIVQYISTRGVAPTLGFADALLTGLARDGGLYAPLALPEQRPEAFRALGGLAYADAAVRVMTPFIAGDFDAAEISAMTADAYTGFRHAATAPLVQIDSNLFALELFHGPTLAFKDFAMQW